MPASVIYQPHTEAQYATGQECVQLMDAVQTIIGCSIQQTKTED